MVDATLQQIDSWYNETNDGSDRPKLLSKLAILELCGWLEEEFDRIVLVAQTGRLNDADWVKKNIILKTSGFRYDDHLRQMLAKLFGEVLVRRIEKTMEAQFPGEIESLSAILGTLWKLRCDLAHKDLSASVAAQQTFHAPSWTQRQFRDVAKIVSHFETVMIEVLTGI